MIEWFAEMLIEHKQLIKYGFVFLGGAIVGIIVDRILVDCLLAREFGRIFDWR